MHLVETVVRCCMSSDLYNLPRGIGSIIYFMYRTESKHASFELLNDFLNRSIQIFVLQAQQFHREALVLPPISVDIS